MTSESNTYSEHILIESTTTDPTTVEVNLLTGAVELNVVDGDGTQISVELSNTQLEKLMAILARKSAQLSMGL